MDIRSAAIYVGTYAKYNNASLDGAWMSLLDYSSKEEFIDDCCLVHKDEDDPELMFQDWENIPNCLISESYISEKFWELIDELDRTYLEEDVVMDYIELRGYNLEKEDITSIISSCEENYCGDYSSEMDFAVEIADELLPSDSEMLRRYFDYEAFCRDLMYDYDYYNGHVFRC